MNNGGDAAEQIVRLSLEGFEVTAKIAGAGAKDIAVLLYTLMKDKKRTAGKTNLTNMLKSGKELKVFSVKADEFKKFTEEAKRYGVLYSALINKKDKSHDGVIDIMVRAEDASKINRIVQRFKLSSYEEASIRSEIEKTREEKQKNKQHKSKEEIIKAEEELKEAFALLKNIFDNSLAYYEKIIFVDLYLLKRGRETITDKLHIGTKTFLKARRSLVIKFALGLQWEL